MKQQTIKISYLLRRELWEHRGLALWLPLVFVVFTLIQNAAGLLVFQEWGGDNFGALVRWAEQQQQLPVEQRDPTLQWGDAKVAVDDWEDLDALVWLGNPNSAMPVLLQLIMLSVVGLALLASVTYASQALYNDRKDRSILFWKSLPVSETISVICKLMFAALIIPLVAFGFGFILLLLNQPLLAQFYASLQQVEFSTAYGMVNPLGMLWVNLGVLLGLSFKLLPLYAWVLCFSAYCKRVPMALALLIPVVLIISERLVLGTHVIATFVGAIFSPGANHWWQTPETMTAGFVEVLSSYSIISGVVAAAFTVALVSASVWLRNHRYEL